ncbi:unnamed protein product [Arctogadus glacialis]
MFLGSHRRSHHRNSLTSANMPLLANEEKQRVAAYPFTSAPLPSCFLSGGTYCSGFMFNLLSCSN